MFNTQDKRNHEIRLERIKAFGAIFEKITTNASDKVVELHEHLLRISYIHKIEKIEKGTMIYYFSFNLNQYKTDSLEQVFIAKEDLSFEDIQKKIIAVANK